MKNKDHSSYYSVRGLLVKISTTLCRSQECLMVDTPTKELSTGALSTFFIPEKYINAENKNQHWLES